MTNWQPYPSSAPAPQSEVAYEPYPTYPDPRVSDSPSTAHQQLAPYVPAVDPYASVPMRPSVTAVQSVKLAAKNWNNFSGRASRSEFWWTALVMLIVQSTIGNAWQNSFAHMRELAAAGSGPSSLVFGAIGLVALAVWLVFFVPFLSLAVRRLHDTGRSGWFVLLSLIPGVGNLITAFFLAQQSDPKGVSYDDPKTPPYGPESL